jgi:large subunit ribosomal protein L9
MKVLLLKDVFKLGRAGDVKRVAAGYGRNYLIPQGLASLATPGMLKQADRIREKATKERVRLNEELASVAEKIDGLELIFAVKAGETGKLYGSITTALITEAIEEKVGATVDRRQIDTQPIKTLGVHSVDVRLTIDLAPTVTVLVHREGEFVELQAELEEQAATEEAEAGVETEAATEGALEVEAADSVVEPEEEDGEAEEA